jgi:hypothetical protein
MMDRAMADGFQGHAEINCRPNGIAFTPEACLPQVRLQHLHLDARVPEYTLLSNL